MWKWGATGDCEERTPTPLQVRKEVVAGKWRSQASIPALCDPPSCLGGHQTTFVTLCPARDPSPGRRVCADNTIQVVRTTVQMDVSSRAADPSPGHVAAGKGPPSPAMTRMFLGGLELSWGHPLPAGVPHEGEWLPQGLRGY